jgi:hypothetical protein
MDPKRNRRIWDRVKITDPRETKQAQLPGGFKCTAVDMGYLLERATEAFGPCGQGFGWTFPFPPFAAGEMAVVSMRFWYLDPEDGSRAEFDVVASSDLFIRRKDGNQVDTDGFKKATTDGLKQALKKVGFMADIYAGKFEEDGYQEQAAAWLDAQKRKEREAVAAPNPTAPPAEAPQATATVTTPVEPPPAALTSEQKCNVLFVRLKRLDAAAAEAVHKAHSGAPTEDAELGRALAKALYGELVKVVGTDKAKALYATLPKVEATGRPDPDHAIHKLDVWIASRGNVA